MFQGLDAVSAGCPCTSRTHSHLYMRNKACKVETVETVHPPCLAWFPGSHKTNARGMRGTQVRGLYWLRIHEPRSAWLAMSFTSSSSRNSLVSVRWMASGASSLAFSSASLAFSCASCSVRLSPPSRSFPASSEADFSGLAMARRGPDSWVCCEKLRPALGECDASRWLSLSARLADLRRGKEHPGRSAKHLQLRTKGSRLDFSSVADSGVCVCVRVKMEGPPKW